MKRGLNAWLRRVAKSRLGFIRKLRLRASQSAQARANYAYDRGRFGKAATKFAPVLDQEMLGALIVMDCHRIEKGMALPSPKPGFGKDVITRLLSRVPQYENQYGPSMPTIIARQALLEYADFNRRIDHEVPVELKAFNQPITESWADVPAGTIEMSREMLLPPAGTDFERFARNRYSIRNYTGEPVSPELIERAVSIAQKTPSVCNRQSGRVHAIFDRNSIDAALSWQNGNRGFGSTVGALLIVTADMRIFNDIGERNQAWIDGGLFAMSLCYALHGLELGSCMLNWSQPKDPDSLMRKALGIPDYEAVIMMLATGHIPPKLRVAVSPRRPLHSVLRVVESVQPRDMLQ